MSAPELKMDHVNQATLELLQRRMESNVRSSFFKTVTLPIGGGGIAALVVAIFVWIPNKVESFLKRPSVQKVVDEQVASHITAYFASPAGKEEMRLKIESVTTTVIKAEVESRLPEEVKKRVDEDVLAYFATGKGRELLKAQVEKATNDHFATSDAQKQIKSLVENYMKTSGRDLVIAQIDKTLRPAVEGIGLDIDTNRDRYVREFEHQSLHGEPKESVGKLNQYLSDSNVKRLKKKGHPIVLTKTIKKGNRYSETVILNYLDGFRGKFGPLFTYVSISLQGPDDTHAALLALIPASQFRAVIKGQRGKVGDLLNTWNKSKVAIVKEIEKMFGNGVTRQVSSTQKVGVVLRDSKIWSTIRIPAADGRGRKTVKPGLEREFAVVDAKGKLVATTTRQRLLEGLVGKVPSAPN